MLSNSRQNFVISDNLTPNPKVRRVNVFRSFRKGTSSRDFVLKPNDVIYVPKTFIGDFNKFMNDMNPTIQRTLNILTLRGEMIKARDWGKIRDR